MEEVRTLGFFSSLFCYDYLITSLGEIEIALWWHVLREKIAKHRRDRFPLWNFTFEGKTFFPISQWSILICYHHHWYQSANHRKLENKCKYVEVHNNTISENGALLFITLPVGGINCFFISRFLSAIIQLKILYLFYDYLVSFAAALANTFPQMSTNMLAKKERKKSEIFLPSPNASTWKRLKAILV